MIELPMIFMAGMLGSAHCLGMCGPFALAIGGNTGNWAAALARQVSYTAGRVFTYMTLGAAAGFCGSSLLGVWPTIVNLPAALAVLAGGLLVYQGLCAVGWLPSREVGGSATCLAGGLFRPLLRHPGRSGAFLAGLFTGLLPCGLLYGMLALAMSTHSVVSGGLTMIVFGVGTAPAMMLAGISGRLMGLAFRRRLLAFAAWCLVLTGIISIARGVSFVSTGSGASGVCPVCRQ